ncbi:4-hydroxythreonine-4-phosphate dehydrogenase PdxA [Bosea sp. BK604]|uniref:PdxA family dehydrogenase n=1 Tax=Bosea sp. BK604 TaxID=2512180 RepID=UPI001052EBA3|nr:4-hydroxythreonine-4-phosphate dehydrogenase PdxA [Bosea sp. BK604]TCR64210.1 4-hydroxythreonine-4-phosphate dehydrogenase [Bosea sp. BK604]
MAVMQDKPRLGLLFGDSTGIGPEIAAKVLAEGGYREHVRLVAIGDKRVLEQGVRDAGVELRWTEVAEGGEIDWDSLEVPLIDLGNADPAALGRGKMSPESGKITGETLAHAIGMAQAGQLDAITFAPLNKAAMFAGGWRFPDEHKMFAHLLKHEGYFSEMNVLDGQWMSRVTSHVSLREALDLIDARAITDAVELVNRMMKRAGIAQPRIAVAALNPHAGENGLFGRDEIELIRPTVERIAAGGIACTGPYPADTVYIRAFAGEFDSVVAMYHDQGQIATKLKGFNRGVTVTAGLDVVFTTPAHGTAFDIVGKGVASPGALQTAIELASRLATVRLAA